MKIEDNKVASINMKVSDQDGTLLEDTSEGDPFMYLHGTGSILAGLETALAGKATGDRVELSLEPAEGFGEINDALKQEIPAEQFQGVDNVEIGMQFEGQTDHGAVVLTVVEVNDETIIVDANHPYAGKTLNFVLDVLDVREATKEELDHGHAHGEDEPIH